jgi:hypothetical protein
VIGIVWHVGPDYSPKVYTRATKRKPDAKAGLIANIF